MWVFLMMVCLLDHNQAAPLPWEHSSLQFLPQQEQELLTPPPDVIQQETSSSSSSSSVSSESSQSSEGTQMLRERQRLENTAVEQMDSFQESSELLQSPSYNNSSLWLNELVLLGQRAGEAHGDAGDNSRAGQRRVTFHHLLSRPRLVGPSLPKDKVAAREEGGAMTEEGGDKGEEVEFPHRLTWDSPGHAHHYDYLENEAGLELGL